MNLHGCHVFILGVTAQLKSKNQLVGQLGPPSAGLGLMRNFFKKYDPIKPFVEPGSMLDDAIVPCA